MNILLVIISVTSTMLLLDSNIIIYASKPEYQELRDYLESNKAELAASAISMVETLNYQLPKSQKKYIEELFQRIKVLAVSEKVIAKAKSLQERKKLKTADAIIAATALEFNAKLATHNQVDFLKVDSLIVIDPFLEQKC